MKWYILLGILVLIGLLLVTIVVVVWTRSKSTSSPTSPTDITESAPIDDSQLDILGKQLEQLEQDIRTLQEYIVHSE